MRTAKMSNDEINKMIADFRKSKSKQKTYHSGRCADFASALKKLLGGGEFYLVGDYPSQKNYHIVLKYGGKYWDVYGKNTLKQIRTRNTKVSIKKKVVTKASPAQEAYLRKCRNKRFMDIAFNGLKRARNKIEER